MVSKITSRGQTTIPKEVRKALQLKTSDSLLYIIDGDRAIIKPVRGNILTLRGAFSAEEEINFKETREKVKKSVGRKTAEALKNE